MSLKPVEFRRLDLPRRRAGLHVEHADHRHGRRVLVGASVAVGHIELAALDVAAERLVQHEAVAGDADPLRRVDGAVMVDERDETVIRKLVLVDPAIHRDDQVALGVVGAALGVHQRAENLHVVGHRRVGPLDGDAERRSRRKGLVGRVRLPGTLLRRRRGYGREERCDCDRCEGFCDWCEGSHWLFPLQVTAGKIEALYEHSIIPVGATSCGDSPRRLR